MILLFNYSKASFYANRGIKLDSSLGHASYSILPYCSKAYSLLIATYVVVLKHPNMKSPASRGFFPCDFYHVQEKLVHGTDGKIVKRSERFRAC